MKITKRIMALCAVSVLSLSMVACGGSEDTNSAGTASSEATASTGVASESDSSKIVIAKVGDTEIYKDALEAEMSYVDYMMQMQYGEDFSSNEEAMEVYNSQKQEILQYLIESEVLNQKAESSDIKVTDDEVEAEYQLTVAEFESEEAFNEALEQSGLTLEELKENIKNNLIIGKLIDQSTAGITVSEAEAEAYYNDNIANYTSGAGANLYHILVETEEQAKEVKAKYDAGESFESLAAEYGTDGTKDNGGSLGFIEYDTTSYDQDFMAGAKTLGEGEVSDPVKSSFGWHIIKADGIKSEETVTPFSEIKDSVIATLEDEKKYAKFSEDLDGWKSEYKIETFEDRL